MRIMSDLTVTKNDVENMIANSEQRTRTSFLVPLIVSLVLGGSGAILSIYQIFIR